MNMFVVTIPDGMFFREILDDHQRVHVCDVLLYWLEVLGHVMQRLHFLLEVLRGKHQPQWRIFPLDLWDIFLKWG
jgi:hypothetical protein